tara:strand:- start:159 stop:455 length:297 start_codon:yes stop_codon:yes gene_type:complete
MKILFNLLIYLNGIIMGVAVLLASPMFIIIFINVVCIKYLKDKPTNTERFKSYCWTMYVVNCNERSDEGECLITFLEYMERNEDFLKTKYANILENGY